MLLCSLVIVIFLEIYLLLLRPVFKTFFCSQKLYTCVHILIRQTQTHYVIQHWIKLFLCNFHYFIIYAFSVSFQKINCCLYVSVIINFLYILFVLSTNKCLQFVSHSLRDVNNNTILSCSAKLFTINLSLFHVPLLCLYLLFSFTSFSSLI